MSVTHGLIWLEVLAVLSLAVAVVVARASHRSQRWLQFVAPLVVAGIT